LPSHCQSHSNQCVENFYKDNVVQSLRGMKSSDEDRKKMAKALVELHATEDLTVEDLLEDDVEVDTDLLQQLADKLRMGEDVKEVPAELTQDFQDMLQSGQLAQLIEPWCAWWTRQPPKVQITLDC